MSGYDAASDDTANEAYEAYMGRWSRLVGDQFLEWLDLPDGLRWLDMGCGTGALSQTILKQCAPSGVIGIDPSDDYIAYANSSTYSGVASFQVGDAQALPFDDESFDVVVSALAINFVPDKTRAASEMVRVVRRGGTAALYVWDLAGSMNMMRHFWKVATTVDPEAVRQNNARGSEITRPEALTDLFNDAGLQEIETRPINIMTSYQKFDDYWLPIINNTQAVGRYCQSLPEMQLTEIRNRLSDALPTENDGTIAFAGRAWAIRGNV